MDPWEDPDMDPDNGRMNLEDLGSGDRPRFEAFMRAWDIARELETPQTWIEAGDLGMDAYRSRVAMPVGLEKLVVLNVGWCGINLWDDHCLGSQSDPYLVFAVEAIKARGWGPDGNRSPLGVHHTYITMTLTESGYVFERSGDTYRRPTRRRGLLGRDWALNGGSGTAT